MPNKRQDTDAEAATRGRLAAATAHIIPMYARRRPLFGADALSATCRPSFVAQRPSSSPTYVGFRSSWSLAIIIVAKLRRLPLIVVLYRRAPPHHAPSSTTRLQSRGGGPPRAAGGRLVNGDRLQQVRGVPPKSVAARPQARHDPLDDASLARAHKPAAGCF